MTAESNRKGNLYGKLLLFSILGMTVASTLLSPSGQRLIGEKRGNTASNLYYNGIAAEADGWIYTIDASSEYRKLYKVRSDGSEAVQLFKQDCKYLNVSGDWLYALCGVHLYKINTRTGESSELYSNATKIILVGDWIYCQDYKPVGLSKIRTDGSHQTTVLQGEYNLLDVQSGWLYCTFREAGIQNLYRINADDGQRVLAVSDVRSPVIEGGWLYQRTRANGYQNANTGLERVNLHSGRREVLAEMECSFPFIDGKTVYFNAADGIYQVKTDGTGLTKISNNRYYYICATKDWLIYRDQTLYNGFLLWNYNLRKMRKDGSGDSVFWGDSQDKQGD